MRAAVAVLAGLLLGAAGPAAADGAYKAEVKVTPLLDTAVDSAGAPIRYPETDRPQVRALIVELPPGAETGWHSHPLPLYAYMLDGAVEVVQEDGTRRTFAKGEAFPEMVGRAHNGTSVGEVPARILVFVTGEEGRPFTVKADPPAKAP